MITTSVQLYSVRDAFAADPAGTLARLRRRRLRRRRAVLPRRARAGPRPHPAGVGARRPVGAAHAGLVSSPDAALVLDAAERLGVRTVMQPPAVEGFLALGGGDRAHCRASQRDRGTRCAARHHDRVSQPLGGSSPTTTGEPRSSSSASLWTRASCSRSTCTGCRPRAGRPQDLRPRARRAGEVPAHQGRPGKPQHLGPAARGSRSGRAGRGSQRSAECAAGRDKVTPYRGDLFEGLAESLAWLDAREEGGALVTAAAGVGIIGAGVISGQYLENLSQYPDVEVRFVGDIDVDRAHERARYGVPGSGTVDELLARDDIEIVVNLAIPAAHAEIGARILDAGKHVFRREAARAQPRGGPRAAQPGRSARSSCAASAPDTMLGAGMQSARRAIRRRRDRAAAHRTRTLPDARTRRVASEPRLPVRARRRPAV